MKWIYKIQQRIAITETESWALIVLAGLMGLGLTVREVQKHIDPIPDGFYATEDSLFAAAVSDSTTTPDSTGLYSTDRDTTKSRKKRGATSESEDEPGSEGEANVRMNLNTATATQLIRLPGIGPALAERILAYREENGPFGSVDELRKVKGIGAKKLEKIRGFLFVSES